jgi:hypothetical protein
MDKLLHVSLITSLVVATSYAKDETAQVRERIPSVKKVVGNIGKTEDKEISTVDQFKHMFSDAKITGQIRAMYAGYDYKDATQTDTYASAFGGGLKYELASLYGFNGAVAFKTSQDIGFISGEDEKHNPELSSSKGNYTDISEAYINYNYRDFNFKAGRQTLDTPLADSDDIRMIMNTFEAYMATYSFNGFHFLAGNIQKWQGYDAGLDDGWVKAGKDGANVAGVSYEDEIVKFGAWYYNISKLSDIFYTDLHVNYRFDKDFSIHAAVQYLKENELENSTVEAEIYGGMVEFVAFGLGFNFAYNNSSAKQGKASFSGTGGGTLFTSMDTMILDEIAIDRDASSMVAGLSYTIEGFSLLYAYGDFKGDENTMAQKAHIVEQDIGCGYNVDDEFIVAAIYVLEEDRENSSYSENDWNRLQVMINYNF